MRKDRLLPAKSRYDTVYVLGAGSSVVAGAPTMATFRRMANTVRSGPFGGSGSREKFEQALAFWENRHPEANIEELYVLVDTLYRTGSSDRDGTEKADAVQFLIAKTLEASIKSPSSTHLRFVRKAWAYADQPVCAISLNWDTVLERAICADGKGVDHLNGMGSPPDRWDGTPKYEAHEVLKLHGSLNWRVCGDCRMHGFMPPGHGCLDIWESTTPLVCACGSENAWLPGFVPPMSQKLGAETPIYATLRDQWQQAYARLQRCDRLVIIGYSFPATDLQFRMFLLDALGQNQGLQEIIAVTDRKWGDRKLQFENHYDQIFRNSPHGRSLVMDDHGFDVWSEQDDWWLRQGRAK